ncbi:hypothetical protein A1O3_05291 [Capronia epimyces CBS 606.96]|uniref:Rhodopsin domain-containing protein n=1 Tax=Capronia epimyces CBS 606.96 TaxID=1182542 RepID=W9Y5X1_9EURO|nr:uncharacterized protein A1O3_05291 [Capronia epimyces CBS 606.96]EXJ84621.1 hypothetical protein A1O3_05291 [Capronia epimyces CBS 606.96]
MPPPRFVVNRSATTPRLADRLPGWDRFQWADVAVVLALAFALPMGVMEFFMSSDGFGKDIWTLPFDKITRIIKFTWLTEIFYMCVLGLTKVAILLLYLKVFPTQPFRKLAMCSVVVCVAYIPAFALSIAFHCVPLSYGWTGWTGETQGHCFNLNAFAWGHAIINIILDLWVIFLPIPELLHLHLGRRKKVHLILMFSVGLFITVVSVVRLTSLVRFANSQNATYDNVPTAYWSVLEAFVSIICCCLPAIRSLLRRVFPTCFGSSSDPESHGTNYRISTPMHTGDVKRSMGMSVNVSGMPRSGDSDVIELVDKDNSSGKRDDWR